MDTLRVTSLQKVISGGQTGVDRAALDVAISAGREIGGWCPRGRFAEDGIIDNRYPLQETPKRRYVQRTDWNVRDSDGTLVLYRGELRGGTLATVKLARDKYRRPLLPVDLLRPPPAKEVTEWVIRKKIEILNVAGPRESNNPGIYEDALRYLERLLSA